MKATVKFGIQHSLIAYKDIARGEIVICGRMQDYAPNVCLLDYLRFKTDTGLFDLNGREIHGVEKDEFTYYDRLPVGTKITLNF